jgi:hypothetical protein
VRPSWLCVLPPGWRPFLRPAQDQFRFGSLVAFCTPQSSKLGRSPWPGCNVKTASGCGSILVPWAAWAAGLGPHPAHLQVTPRSQERQSVTFHLPSIALLCSRWPCHPVEGGLCRRTGSPGFSTLLSGREVLVRRTLGGENKTHM